MSSTTALRDQLARLAGELNLRCADRWVVIGSAAAWLVGADVEVGDIDILTSARDAEVLIAAWAEHRLPIAPSANDDLFRSRYGRFGFEPLRVEIMGDLDVYTNDRWQPVRVRQSTPIDVDGAIIDVPTRIEQVRLLRLFGREKDLARIASLTTHSEPH
jgi:hypothetical protein